MKTASNRLAALTWSMRNKAGILVDEEQGRYVQELTIRAATIDLFLRAAIIIEQNSWP